MRANGVQHAKVGDLELDLADAPAAPMSTEKLEGFDGGEGDEIKPPRSVYDDPWLYPGGRVPGFKT